MFLENSVAYMRRTDVIVDTRVGVDSPVSHLFTGNVISSDKVETGKVSG